MWVHVFQPAHISDAEVTREYCTGCCKLKCPGMDVQMIRHPLNANVSQSVHTENTCCDHVVASQLLSCGMRS